MEMASPNDNEINAAGLFTCVCLKLKALPKNIWNRIAGLANKAKKLAKDDPRRIIHSLKVALALTLVSLFYYFKPLYDGFGVSAMWAVLTVVVVFEFSVGATLGKGLNRMFATLIAGAFGVAAYRIATYAGRIGEPIVIAIFVFIVAAIITFVRFIPKMKARYDYGLLISILTFCLISVSGYRDDEMLEMAHKRVTTIAIGSVASVLVCVLICPVWVGQDLHNLVATNIDKLGNFLEGFGAEYFTTSEDEQAVDTNESFLQGFKSVLASKNNEESMANLARWEPCHGQFKFRHPWKQYLKVGSLSRQCANKIEALNGYLNSEIQVRVEIRSKLKETCTTISSETGKALKELASSVKTMTRISTTINPHIKNSKVAAETLKLLLSNTSFLEDASLLEIIPAASVASLLIDIVTCTEKIAESVEELASLANFKCSQPEQQQHLLHRGAIQPISDGSHHVINIDDELSPSSQQTENPSAPTIS